MIELSHQTDSFSEKRLQSSERKLQTNYLDLNLNFNVLIKCHFSTVNILAK